MTKKKTGPDAGSEPKFDGGPDVSRRGFLGGAAVGGLTAAGLGFNVATSSQAQAGGDGWSRRRNWDRDPPKGGGSKDRVLLKGGVVLTLDPVVGDFEKADVLIEGKKIVSIRPNISASAKVVDCSGMIVMPGFISTHNHQYEAIQRSIIADGLIVFAADSDNQTIPTTNAVYEAYGTVVQSIWTSGRLGSAIAPQWDLGRSPYDPEDCYNAELIACLSQITQGITCGTDTSQSSHSPQHTDALIKGCIDSGRRTLFDYSNGVNREPNQPEGSRPLVPKKPYNVPTDPYEFPGAVLYPGQKMGLKRIAEKWFNSSDQLVTLGFSGGPTPIANLPTPYAGMTGWELGREFGAFINNHNVGNAATPKTALDANLAPFDDVTLVHCVRWQDNNIAQLSYGDKAYPGGDGAGSSEAWKIWSDNGGHVSIAGILEMQMRHGMPPFQLALNHGILPSLSPDVDTNMTPDPFSMMRGAFCIQRGLANDLAFGVTSAGPPATRGTSDPGNLPIPQLLTCKQTAEMMTVAGAAGSGLSKKVGRLSPGKEADIVILDYDNINTQPMNNAYGTVVTMMDTRHVKHVMIAGKFVYWNGDLVGWNVDKVVDKAIRSRDNVLRRINGPAWGSDTGIIHRTMNGQANPYRPNFLDSCCYKGQNLTAPHYVYRG
jgi:5-methylthioadenosine/S-adenosylhomocysteine deaminase